MQRTILITGCSSGIGLASARFLRARGWRVLATCRQTADCARLTAEGFDSFPLDYADPASLDEAMEAVRALTGGRLDALFNNGAFACPGAVEDLPRDALESVFQTNLFGVHDLTRRVIPLMRAQGSGTVVNCSSVLGFVPMKWRGAYVASKYALEGLTDVLRLEMRDTGVRIVLIEPGPVTSRIRANSIPHFERWIDWRASPRRAQYEGSLLRRLYEDRGPDRFERPPEAVARVLERALAARNPAPRYFVTTPTWIMAGLRRLLPTRALDAILARG